MAVEFGAEIVLKSDTALRQMQKFSRSTKEAGETLKELQKQAKSTAQGLGEGTFAKYVDGLKKASATTTKLIKQIHDHKGAYSKLNDEQKSVVQQMDRLNQKYDESARAAANLKRVENELRMLVGSGLKTQKEANAILDQQAIKINKTTRAYKENQAIIRKNLSTKEAEKKVVHDLNMKYNKAYAVKTKEKRVIKDLNVLYKKNLITAKEYNAILKNQKILIEHTTSQFQRMAGAQSLVSKAARLVSIYSRVFLGLYAGARLATFWTDIERISEKIGLLDQKLQFLTGESGAYRKFFNMTQEVGIEMDSANKIITRFAVVTNRAFSMDTMNEWSSTLIRSARATGTSTQEMSGALIQITQAMSAGRLMGDEYRSVTENLPLLTVALRDLFGKSTLSLKELSSQGLLTNKVLIKGFENLKVMLEGFPDTTDTVDAAIGRLSSSWDNFIASVLDTDVSKSIMNQMSEWLTGSADAFDNAAKQREESEKNILTARRTRLQSWIDAEKQAIKDVESERDKSGSVLGNVTNLFNDAAVEESRKNIDKYNKILKITVERMKEIGVSQEDINKIKADRKIQEERELNRIYKEELKTLKLIEKIEKGKTVETIKKRFELLRNELKSKEELFAEGEAGGIKPSDAKDLNIQIDRNEKDALQKRYKTKVDAYLRLNELKTDFDLKTIQDELGNNGKLLEIQKKFELRKLQIQSGMVARTKGIEIGLRGEALSKFTKQLGEEMLSDLEIKRFNDVQDEIDKIVNSIEKLGNSALKTSAIFKRDKIGLLEITEKGIVENFDKQIIDLKDNFKKLGANVDETNVTLKEHVLLINQAKEDAISTARRNFDEGLSKTFSESNAALIKYTNSTRDLETAKTVLVVTDAEYIRQLKLINEEYNHQINLTKSIHHEMIGINQVYAGIGRGVENLTNNIETMYEMTTNTTEDLIDGSIDLLVRHSEDAKAAFASLVQSILIDMQKIIIKQAIINAMGGMFGGFGSSSPTTNIGAESLGAGSTSAFDTFSLNSKGNTFLGGISGHSNSVVSKPTVFQFAKGIGIMGEGNDPEAIMPLKRGKDGKLGVTVSSDSRGGSSTKNVSVSIENIGNNESEIISSKATTDMNGIVVKIVLDDLIKGGPIRDSVQNLGEYG